ncbi:MAG: DUF2220 domain-containing protein [Candidatus Absconditabacterales bacterium]|nr:DUF2220 domain-containing protein [Candidatus Absconditabacterales bacterium]
MMQLYELEYQLTLQDIYNLLNDVLNKLDLQPACERTNNIQYPINAKVFPSLYNPRVYKEDEDIENAIQILIDKEIFTIKQSKKETFVDIRNKSKAKLIFNYNFEQLLRSFYKREVQTNSWKENIEQLNCNADIKELMLNNRITIHEKKEYDIATQLLRLLTSNNENKSVRHVSAKYFWGMSKVLDNREQIINYCKLRTMPILLHVKAMGNNPETILFIENQDTYIEAINSENAIFENYILIFSSGFKASAKRIRTENGSKIFFEDNCFLGEEGRKKFKQWLYGDDELEFNIYFWGDLDFSGMNILSSLKKVFPNLKAWEYGYNKLLNALDYNNAHSPNLANKEGQTEPSLTGCKFTDTQLIPALKYKQLFIDQEFADLSEGS